MDRVLDEATHTDPTTGETLKHYLVKWRSLQYEDSTWELEEDVDPEKIAQFIKFNKVPPKDQWKVIYYKYNILYNIIYYIIAYLYLNNYYVIINFLFSQKRNQMHHHG